MAAVRVTTRAVFNKANLDAVVGGAVKKDITRRSAHVRRRAREILRAKQTTSGSGRLRRALKYVVEGERGRWVGTIYVDDSIARSPATKSDPGGFAYGLAVHDGTGQYGPKRRVIRPRTAPAMRWDDRATGRVVRRLTVRGQRPKRYLKDALPAARD